MFKIERKNSNKFEYIYDRFSPLLYGIILKISINQKDAESILLKSFKIFFSQKPGEVPENLIFLHILRITIGVTADHINVSKEEIGKMILQDFHQNASQLTNVFTQLGRTVKFSA